MREAEGRHAAAPIGDFNSEARGNGNRLRRTRSDRTSDFALQSWTELAVSGATHIAPDTARFSAIDLV